MNRQTERSTTTISAIRAAARKLFAAAGFEATSIDDIAAQAGVAKGAIYHHFASKEEIFVQVLDGLQAELAAAPIPASARLIADPLDRIAAGVQRYLDAAMQPSIKRILLLDGPVVIGWGKWRQIDERYFGAGTRAVLMHALGKHLTEAEVDALAHLVAGAVMEAALICAASSEPAKSAREHVAALRKLLEGPRAVAKRATAT